MSKRRKQKRSVSQILFWILSLIIVLSMIISLIIVALEPAPRPAPTLPPATFTPFPSRTPTSGPTAEPTEPVVGPEPPTATPNPASGAFKPVAAAGQQRTVAMEWPAEAGQEPRGGGSSPMAEPSSGAAPTEVAELRFAVAGDSHNSGKVYGRVLKSVADRGAAFLIHTGDLVYSQGTEAQWQKFEKLMADFPLPFYPVPGNHDSLNGELDGYLAHSGAPAAAYSFDRGTVHFALADSHNGGMTAAGLDWLRQDLSATTQPVKIVVLHHPPFDPDGGDHVMAFGNNKFMNLVAELGVDYVFSGHIHAFVRGEREGVQYDISGGAGRTLYYDGHPQAMNHYVLVTVRGEDVIVEMVKV
ncbi:MAG: metallophosphoesterase [Anaerolineae bacterium]